LKYKFIKIIALALILEGGFTSCSDNNELQKGYLNKITAKVENASEFKDVVEVKLLVWDPINRTDVEIASSYWNNGGFKIVINESKSPTYLHPLICGDWYWSIASDFDKPSTVIDEQQTVTISNKDIKLVDAFFVGFDKDGYRVATFSLVKFDKNGHIEAEAKVSYINSDVNISGYTYPSRINYSIDWEKGWNIWYRSTSQKRTGDDITTTQLWSSTPVKGLKWYGNSSSKA